MGSSVSRCCERFSDRDGTAQHQLNGWNVQRTANNANKVAAKKADDFVGYQGDTDPDGRRHGHGVLRTREGDIFEGEFRNGKMHGKGLHRSANGDEYEGQWSRDQRHGSGTYRFASGAEYSGQWRSGEMHGEGIFSFDDGGSYEGQFRDGDYYGEGTIRFWWNGRLHYKGTLAAQPTSAEATVPADLWTGGPVHGGRPSRRSGTLPLLAPRGLERPRSRFGAIVPPDLIDLQPHADDHAQHGEAGESVVCGAFADGGASSSRASALDSPFSTPNGDGVRASAASAASGCSERSATARARTSLGEVSFRTHWRGDATPGGTPLTDSRGVDSPHALPFTPQSPAAFHQSRVDMLAMAEEQGRRQ